AIYITGWRLREITGLTGADVNLAENTITLDAARSKTKTTRTVPMTPELRKIVEKQLASIKRVEKKGRIVAALFHRPSGLPVRSFRKRWKAAREAAGYPQALLHDFRRSAAKNLTRAGVSEQVAMKLLGHATNSTFRRYNVSDTTDL